MTSVTITFDDGSTHTIQLSDQAKDTIRYAFNPSALPAVHTLKALSGAFITEIEAQKSQKPNASWQFGKAIEHATSASMWAVLAATKSV